MVQALRKLEARERRPARLLLGEIEGGGRLQSEGDEAAVVAGNKRVAGQVVGYKRGRQIAPEPGLEVENLGAGQGQGAATQCPTRGRAIGGNVCSAPSLEKPKHSAVDLVFGFAT